VAKNAAVIGFDRVAGTPIAEFGQGGFCTLPILIISQSHESVNDQFIVWEKLNK
jgi:hypothetical protein